MDPHTAPIEIGTIRRAHGIRGALRVQLHDEGSAALEVLAQVIVGGPEGRRYAIGGAQDLGGGAYLLQLAGIEDRDAADALRGRPLFARREDLPPLEDGEYYLSDLVGCEVSTAAGAAVGRVRAVPQIGGQDMLEIERPGRGEALVPLRPEFVTAVDVAGRRVEIDPPEGLLDLDLPERGARAEAAAAQASDEAEGDGGDESADEADDEARAAGPAGGA